MASYQTLGWDALVDEGLSSVEPATATLRTHRGKRIFDVVFAIGALFFLLPLMGIAALMALVFQGRPILFKHMRCGRGGKKFACLKFRTMIPNSAQILEKHLDADPSAAKEWQENQKLLNDPRVTRLGRFLRATSIDEVPQIINILKGDMSFVGPRPIVEQERDRYGENVKVYDSVLPGLTGLWQISGRNEVSYDSRVNLDVKYARDISVKKDLVIILKTLPAVFLRTGAS